ncbi:uncharacterized protein N7515_002017 [Penicillium bovifimosum]|uniref:Uncharacterized protein n=1 Tax=Penicillium bovifimosum TaxID=126998 RepID=A0A9W9HBF2_9EURO|nr:uncharacterized protein N7515_002017 [Penicillium bovifimosum]KAJ5143230.1 hypothetical protein N7515_002017 [Penicillium bovifimosum]
MSDVLWSSPEPSNRDTKRIEILVGRRRSLPSTSFPLTPEVSVRGIHRTLTARDTQGMLICGMASPHQERWVVHMAPQPPHEQTAETQQLLLRVVTGPKDATVAHGRTRHYRPRSIRVLRTAIGVLGMANRAPAQNHVGELHQLHSSDVVLPGQSPVGFSRTDSAWESNASKSSPIVPPSPPLRNDSTEDSSSAAPSAPVAVERPYDPSDPDPNDNGPGSVGSRPESPPIRDR